MTSSKREHFVHKKKNETEKYSPELLAKALFPLTMRMDPKTKAIGVPLDALLKITDSHTLTRAIQLLEIQLKERGFELIAYTYEKKDYIASRLKYPSFSSLTNKDYNVLALVIYFIEAMKQQNKKIKGIKRQELEEFCYKTEIEIKNYLKERLSVLEAMGYLKKTSVRPITYNYGPRLIVEIPKKVRTMISEAIKNQLMMA